MERYFTVLIDRNNANHISAIIFGPGTEDDAEQALMLRHEQKGLDESFEPAVINASIFDAPAPTFAEATEAYHEIAKAAKAERGEPCPLVSEWDGHRWLLANENGSLGFVYRGDGFLRTELLRVGVPVSWDEAIKLMEQKHAARLRRWEKFGLFTRDAR